MNDSTRIALLERLLSRRQAIAEAWYDSIALPCFERFDRAKIQPYFIGLTEQMMTLLLTKPPWRTQAQEIGLALSHLGLGAKAMVRTQEVLAQQIAQLLPPEQLLLLQPQLVGLLGEVARGFFKQKVEDCGRLTREFLPGMSHDLRTPLNSIIGYTEIMLRGFDGPLNDEQRKDLIAISWAGQHLLEVLNDILDMARFEAGYQHTHLQLTTFEIASLIKESSLWRRTNSDVTLRVDCPPTLGSMHADKGKIEQVLESLLRQAVAFTASGEIRFTGWRDSSQERDWVCFQITGTGDGISPVEVETLKTLFAQKVEQGKLLDSIKYGSHKFMMEVTHHLCQFMSGTISVEHEAGKGITFTVRLPIEHIGSALVISDKAMTRHFLAQALRQTQYRVEMEGSGIEALQTAKSVQPDLIVLDVLMRDIKGWARQVTHQASFYDRDSADQSPVQEMNGWMLLSRLKADAAFANTPLIMVAMAEEGHEGLVLNVDKYLSKPTPHDYLRLTWRRYHHQLVSTKHKQVGQALIVEHDTAYCDWLQRIVQKEHWEVRTAPDGQSALAQLTHQAPDLLFLNLSIPHQDSIQLLTQLHHHPQWQSIPVVMLLDKELTSATCQQLTHSTNQRLRDNASECDSFLRHLTDLVNRHLCE